IFGIDPGKACEVDESEEQVSELTLLIFGGRSRGKQVAELADLLLDLVPRPIALRKIEADAGRLLLDAVSTQQGRQVAWHALQRGALLPFVEFDLFPVTKNLLDVRHIHIPEDVRMAADQLLGLLADDVHEGE